MNYTITPTGVHFVIEDEARDALTMTGEPIPDAEAIRIIQRIAAKLRGDDAKPTDTAATVDTREEAAQRGTAAA